MNRFLIPLAATLVAATAIATRGSEERAIATGTISGVVRAPGVRGTGALTVTSDVGVCGPSLPAEEIVTTPDGKLRYAVVALEEAPRVEAPRRRMAIRNVKCAFVPHVQSGNTGDALLASNGDPMLHNVRLKLRMGDRARSLANLALPGQSRAVNASRATRFPGVVEIRCDAHEWMSAYILLFDHPFHAVTAGDGSFTIAGVPAGRHTVRVWHERLGELTGRVTVEPGKTARVDFSYGGRGR